MISDQGNVGGLACSDLICPLGICKLNPGPLGGPGYNSGNKIKKLKSESNGSTMANHWILDFG